MKSLKNRGDLLKGTKTRFTSQEGGFVNFFRPLITAGLPLMKSALAPLSKSLLILLGLPAGVSAADAAIQKKIYGSVSPSVLVSRTTALTISNEGMEDIKKIVKSCKELGLLIKVMSVTTKNEAKEQTGVFLPMLLRTLAASILGNALTGRGVIRAGGTIKAGQDF